MKPLFVTIVCILSMLSFYGQQTQQINLTLEEIEYLLEQGVPQEDIDSYLANVLSSENKELIDLALENYRQDFNEEQLETYYTENGEYNFDTTLTLTSQEISDQIDESNNIVDNLELFDLTGLNLKGTQTKRSFLNFINNNRAFIIKNAEIMVIWDVIFSLINNNVNLFEILKDQLLPVIGFNGNPLETLYDREMTYDNIIFDGKVAPEKLNELTNIFNSTIDQNFSEEVANLIKNNN